MLSVIIPTFDRPEATDRALASALREAPADAEVLVVDDGSPRPYAPAVRDSRLRVLRHERNRGAAAARNTGLAAAQGTWAALLDSDDVWPLGSLAPRLAEALGCAEPLTVWAAAFRDVWPDGRVRERRPRPSRDVADFASGCWFCPGSTALFQRRAVLETVGPFDEALARLEDLDWFLRLGLAGGGLGVSPVIAAEIARGTKAPPAVLAHAARHLAAKYASGPLALSRDNQRRLRAYLALETAASARDAGNPLSAARALVQSWLAAPRARAPLRRFWV